jgi:hypothetical protein
MIPKVSSKIALSFHSGKSCFINRYKNTKRKATEIPASTQWVRKKPEKRMKMPVNQKGMSFRENINIKLVILKPIMVYVNPSLINDSIAVLSI